MTRAATTPVAESGRGDAAPRRAPLAAWSRGRARRRGSIYAVVLGMALLVSLIGLSAVAVGRVNLRAATAGGEGADAELLALSGVEFAATVINTDPTWRTKFPNDTYSAPSSLGRGTLSWKRVDDDPSRSGAQPVRVYGFGRAGEARRCFSLLLTPGGTSHVTNGDAESGITGYAVAGGDCVLESSTVEPRGGLRCLSVRSRLGASAGPQQDLTGKVVAGGTYYVEAWVRMTAGSDAPVFTVIARGSGLLGLPLGATEWSVTAQGQTAGLGWTRVYATFDASWSGLPDTVVLRVGTALTSQDFRLDDLRLVTLSTLTPMAPAFDTWKQEQLP